MELELQNKKMTEKLVTAISQDPFEQDSPYYDENWETFVEHICNNLGGLCYTAGSILFLPQYVDDYELCAAILFIFGSVLFLVAFFAVYIAVSKHEADFLPSQGHTGPVTHDSPVDVQEEDRSAKTNLRLALVTCFIFLFSCCFFVPGLPSYLSLLGIILFFAASLLFSIVGYLQLKLVSKSWKNHEMSDTLGQALVFVSYCYIFGAGFFMIGCVCFLFDSLYVVAVWIFILGSIAFLGATMIKPILHLHRIYAR